MTASPTPIESSASSSSVEAFIVDPAALTAPTWRRFLAYLSRAIPRSGGDTDADAVLIAVASGRAQLWGVEKAGELAAAGITRILTKESGSKVLVIQLASADNLTFDEMRFVVARAEEFGRRSGCGRVRIYGRRGWAKVLPDYDPLFTVLDKEI